MLFKSRSLLLPAVALAVMGGLFASNKTTSASMLIGVNAYGAASGNWLSDDSLFASYVSNTDQGGASTGDSISENGVSITGNASTNQGTNTGSTIASTYVTDDAPQSVLQHNRYSDNVSGNFIDYTISGLNSGSMYQVNLDFAELYFSATGGREFGVTINGTPVLGGSNAGTQGDGTFDVNATAESLYGTSGGGKNQAFTESFDVTANSNGQLLLDFMAGKMNNPIINGFSIDTVPAPATLWMVGEGALGLVLLRRRRKTAILSMFRRTGRQENMPS